MDESIDTKITKQYEVVEKIGQGANGVSFFLKN